MAHKTVDLNAGGALPTIELRFSKGLFAKYDVYLYDRLGGDPQPIAENQTNADTVSDTYSVGTTVADLHQRILFWQGAISVFDNQPGQNYLMRAVVSQNGAVIGTFDKRGLITNTVVDQDTVRFIVK